MKNQFRCSICNKDHSTKATMIPWHRRVSEGTQVAVCGRCLKKWKRSDKTAKTMAMETVLKKDYEEEK